MSFWSPYCAFLTLSRSLRHSTFSNDLIFQTVTLQKWELHKRTFVNAKSHGPGPRRRRMAATNYDDGYEGALKAMVDAWTAWAGSRKIQLVVSNNCCITCLQTTKSIRNACTRHDCEQRFVLSVRVVSQLEKAAYSSGLVACKSVTQPSICCVSFWWSSTKDFSILHCKHASRAQISGSIDVKKEAQLDEFLLSLLRYLREQWIESLINLKSSWSSSSSTAAAAANFWTKQRKLNALNLIK